MCAVKPREDDRSHCQHYGLLRPSRRSQLESTQPTFTIYEGRKKCSAVAEMGDRLATIDMDRKVGGCCALFRGWAGSPSNTMWPGPRPTSILSGILIHPAVLPQYIWPKSGVCCSASPFLGEGGELGAGSPSNTMWPGPRPTSLSSGILIHPTVWPQYTNVTDRIDRQLSDSIGRSRSVLQTVDQNDRQEPAVGNL